MRLLLVDDEKELLENLKLAFRPTAYECDTETNPLVALERYKQQRYDVVITDVRMPEISGLDLLKLLREYDPSAKVIIITGYGDLDTAIKAINNHAYAFFGKPLDFKDLINTLREIASDDFTIAKREIDYQQLRRDYQNLKITYEQLLQYLRQKKQEIVS